MSGAFSMQDSVPMMRANCAVNTATVKPEPERCNRKLVGEEAVL
jgi:hypothetical protein